MESDKFKLGLFIVLAFFLALGLFVAFGVFDYTSEKAPMMSLFKESVQGLETGSFVKFRGVPIGKVKDITISIEDNLIRVDMEINLAKVRTDPFSEETGEKSGDSHITKAKFYEFMKREIEKGLRARLELNGISGFKYVELDYHEKSSAGSGDDFAPAGLDAQKTFYMPSEPSMMAGLRNGITETIAKIASIDYKQIADRLDKLLVNADKIVSDPSITQAVENIDKLTAKLASTVEAVNTALPESKIKEIGEESIRTIASMKQLAATLDKNIKDVQFGKSAESFRGAADSVTEFRKSVRETLGKLNEAIDAFTELAKMIDENPTAFVRGKQPSSGEKK